MTTATYAGLRPANRADSLKPDAKDMKPDHDEMEGDEAEAEESGDKPKGKKKDKEYMNEDQANAAVAEARADERARCIAVMSSEHFAGREAQAAKLLAKDGLSADDVIELLAAMEPAKAADPEAAARAEMQDALAEAGNYEIEANDRVSISTDASAANVWDGALARVFGTNKTA